MSNRSSLVNEIPNLHLDQEFYYRCLATVQGKNAETSKAYGIQVCHFGFGFLSFSGLF